MVPKNCRLQETNQTINVDKTRFAKIYTNATKKFKCFLLQVYIR
jgi:hypothetical protein